MVRSPFPTFPRGLYLSRWRFRDSMSTLQPFGWGVVILVASQSWRRGFWIARLPRLVQFYLRPSKYGWCKGFPRAQRVLTHCSRWILRPTCATLVPDTPSWWSSLCWTPYVWAMRAFRRQEWRVVDRIGSVTVVLWVRLIRPRARIKVSAVVVIEYVNPYNHIRLLYWSPVCQLRWT